jgi:Zn finger protein HypA/HybF involved in hydrogenase expression
MTRQNRSKLVSPRTDLGNQALDALEEVSLPEQEKEQILTELDNEIECPRCHEFMELQSNFDKLVYYCENCSFLLKCV